MTDQLILVTGASGKTGRRVVQGLENAGVAYRAVSRKSDPRFDWDDESSWPAAVAGVTVVYLVVPDLGTPEAVVKVGKLAQLLAAHGKPRVVLVATPDDDTDFSRQARATEAAITSAGLVLTSLRLRWFFQNFSEDFLMPAVMAGSMRLPAGDGRDAFVDAEDIAEVAVAALTDDRHAGRSYEVSGPRVLGFEDIAGELSRATGRTITYTAVTPETFIAEETAAGLPDEFAWLLSSVYQQIATGELATVSGDVEAVLGKPPRDFSDYARKTAAEGGWDEGAGGSAW